MGGAWPCVTWKQVLASVLPSSTRSRSLSFSFSSPLAKPHFLPSISSSLWEPRRGTRCDCTPLESLWAQQSPQGTSAQVSATDTDSLCLRSRWGTGLRSQWRRFESLFPSFLLSRGKSRCPSEPRLSEDGQKMEPMPVGFLKLRRAHCIGPPWLQLRAERFPLCGWGGAGARRHDTVRRERKQMDWLLIMVQVHRGKRMKERDH